MKNTRSTATLAAVIVGAVMASGSVHAQAIDADATPRAPRELDPAKRIPATPAPATQWQQAPEPTTHPHAGVEAQPYAPQQMDAGGYEDGRGGFFLGVQGGKGWVYEDVDQSALMVNAGYRWQAGPVALVGVEVAAGELDGTSEDGVPVSAVDFASIGVNARFNFGRTSPVYGLVRAGYWSADVDEFGGDVDGAYVGLGLGVDVNRHFNVSVVYTNYVYFEDYYWEGDDFYYDVNRADMLMFGAEVRF
jgi:hypothetical protein